MTATIPNPKFRNEYAINDLQEQINGLGDVGGDLNELTQRVTLVEGVASDALSQAQGAYSVGSAAQESANSAQRTANTALANANNAKAKTDKLTIGSTTNNVSIGENGSASTQPFVQMTFANGEKRSLIWSDSWIELYNNTTSALTWRIRTDMFKYRSFTAKTNLRVTYLYGTLIINLSGITVSFDTVGNWIQIATLSQLGISTYIGLTPMYAAATLDYEYGYECTLRLGPEGLHARAAGSKGGSRYVYGQVIAFAWAISGASPLSLGDGEPEPLEDEDGFPVSDDAVEFVVIGG